MRRTVQVLVITSCVACLRPLASDAATPEELLESIRSVDREGQGNREAANALQQLTQADAAVLVPILKSFQDANPLAANWLRSAFETVCAREIANGKPLPAKQLEAFILDNSQHPRARRLAFEWLAQVDKSIPDRLISNMLHDPSSEFRRDAVARLLQQARKFEEQEQNEQAAAAYRTALSGATDEDQVKEIVEPLRKLKQPVDLQKHFGFLTTWKIIGPFDNREKKGFDAVFPPEIKLEYAANYEGQLGAVAWKPVLSNDDYGLVDIAKQIQNYKGSCMFAATEFHSPGPRAAEFRLGTPNAWKIWLNGRMLFGRDEYHRGAAIDQYRVPGTLQAGRNVVLLKICQNEQTEDWAQRYQFQVRVCDSSGVAILSSDRLTTLRSNTTKSNELSVREVTP